MRDPYLHEDIDVLRNRLGVRDTAELTEAEANITYLLFLAIDKEFEQQPFDFNHLCAVHRYLFGDIYDWAGQPRTIPYGQRRKGIGWRHCTLLCSRRH